MDSDEFDDIRLAVRRYVRDEVVPLEQEIEDRDEVPERVRKTAADMGLFGFALPEQYGGLGLSMEQESRLVFELGYTTPSFRSMFGTNNGIAGHVLMLAANDRAEVRVSAEGRVGGVDRVFRADRDRRRFRSGRPEDACGA